jgi:hypothetical protein
MLIDKKFSEIASAINMVDSVTPLNDYSEKQKFMKKYKEKEVYNPLYNYKKRIISVKRIESKISTIKSKEKIYQNLKENFLKKTSFLKFLGNEDSEPVQIYDPPSKEIYEKAQVLMNSKKFPKQTRNIDSKKARVVFQEQLNSSGLKSWNVELRKKTIANASVDALKKKLILKRRNFSFREIKALINHEIETHVFRSANGYLQKFKILGSIGTTNYLKTEEGLATVMEELNGTHNPVRLKFFYARHIASYLAQSKSFYEIFKVLHERYNLSLNNAYLITKRVKRGLTDTSRPGGFIKDHLYFEGKEMIEKYIKDGKPLIPLFSGKFDIEDYDMLKSKLKPPKYVPAILKNKLLKDINVGD